MVQRGLSGADGAATARNERRDPSGSRLCRIPADTEGAEGSEGAAGTEGAGGTEGAVETKGAGGTEGAGGQQESATSPLQQRQPYRSAALAGSHAHQHHAHQTDTQPHAHPSTTQPQQPHAHQRDARASDKAHLPGGAARSAAPTRPTHRPPHRPNPHLRG